MYYKLICILYALLCGQNFILVKSGCYTTHVAIAPQLCPKGVVVGLKREIVEGKGGKEGEGG
jgi:hypothetical protein